MNFNEWIGPIITFAFGIPVFLYMVIYFAVCAYKNAVADADLRSMLNVMKERQKNPAFDAEVQKAQQTQNPFRR